MAKRHFFSWVRAGTVTAISQSDSQNGHLPARAKLSIGVEAKNDGGASKAGNTTVLLYGPGDTTSQDERMIIRTEPPNLYHAFEPNYFPFVEFDRPDFPWLFTPAKAGANKRLTPWLCLVVVEKALVTLTFDRSKQLPPVLDVPLDKLPDLTDAWAWAHAQVVHEDNNNDKPEIVLRNDPMRNCSRLICPIHLEGKKSYYACLVPTFNAGAMAGLGDPQVEKVEQLSYAWGLGSPQRVQLPVYYHWEFTTSESGDFEDLVRRLERTRLEDPRIGTRFVKVDMDDWPAGVPLPIEGALRVSKSDPPQNTPLQDLQTDTDYQAFQQKLQQFLNNQPLPADLPLPPTLYGRWHAAVSSLPAATEKEWINQLNLNPSYRVAAALGVQIVRDQQEQLMAAAWEQAGEIRLANQKLRQVQYARTTAILLYQQHLVPLNASTLLVMAGPLLTRVRDGANTVAQVVKQSVVPLPLAQGAFRRLTSPRRALARRARVGRLYWPAHLIARVNGDIVEHGETFEQLKLEPDVALPGGTATMDDIQMEGATRFCEFTPLLIAAQAVRTPPPGFDDPALYLPGLVNPDGGTLTDAFSNFIELLTTILEQIDPPDSRRAKVHAALRSASDEIIRFQAALAAGETDNLMRQGLFIYFATWIANMYAAKARLGELIEPLWKAMNELVPEREEIRHYFQLVKAFLHHHEELEGCEVEEIQTRPSLDLAHLHGTLLGALAPGENLARRVQAQVKAPHWQPAGDPLEPVMAAPKFPKPMYQLLAKESHDYLLPGLEHVPPNCVALLETNTAFIEALMVGLNHEMGRELLWRLYPTDQRGTYFYQFWDARSVVPRPSDPDSLHDIPPIVEGTDIWSGELGSHMGGGVDGQSVLLVRGDLLRRYPRTTIFLAKAEQPESGPLVPSRDASAEIYPRFYATLEPDVTLLYFDIAPATMRAQPGYFVVFQQPTTEARFGLDEHAPLPGEAKNTWRDLSWEHTSVAVNTFLTSQTPPHEPNNPNSLYHPSAESLKWDKNSMTSAQLAAITMQLPFRLHIHASDLLPER